MPGLPWLVTLGTALSALALTACPPAVAATVIHVAPGGNDAWTGRTMKPAAGDGPVATPERARDLVRALKTQAGLPPGGVEVVFQAGVYQLARPLELGAQDSGAEGAPVVYRAAPGAEVRFVGGRVVNGWQPVTDPAWLSRLAPEARPHVLRADLRAAGVTEFGQLTQRGFALPSGLSHLELFHQTRPMTLARWPNGGFATITSLPDGAGGMRFGYAGDRPQRWAGETDLWVFAYFYQDWADVYSPVAAIDTAARLITIGGKKPNYGMRTKQRFYVLNCLPELDQPGEWYLDRAAGQAFFWPPEPLRDGDVTVSVLPTILTLDEVAHVEVRGITLECVRGIGATIRGGHHNRLVACTIRNTGGRGVSVTGADSGVVGCDIYDTAEGGISLNGGDRKTLTPARLYAVNNHLYDYSRWCRTYRSAIQVGGVGQRVAHNLVHHGPHMGMGFGGNDHVFEFNEIHSVCYETGDVGAIYSGRDWTCRGTVLRHNYLHHVQGPGRIGAMGIYLDDQYSGTEMRGNLFYRVTRAVFIGGGVDNVAEGNLFVDCRPAMHLDNRGMGWQKKATDDPNGELRTRLTAVGYQQPPYSTRWPTLPGILDDDPGVPKRNRIVSNVSVGGRWDDVNATTRHLQIIERNLVDQDPRFVTPDRFGGDRVPVVTDFALQPDSPAYAQGFQKLPLEQIGLVNDGTRASWPVVHQPLKLPAEMAAEPAPPPTTPVPTYQAERVAMAPTIDGTIAREEWLGAEPGKAIVLAQDYRGAAAKPLSHAWVLWDDQALWVAVDNQVAAGTLRPGTAWGASDAVELAVKPFGAKDAPTVVLRGYPGGQFTVAATTATGALAARETAGVAYHAQAAGPDHWTVEWRIPWAVLGLDPARQSKLAFNVTCRKVAADLWLMWRGTGGNSYLADRAGVLTLGR